MQNLMTRCVVVVLLGVGMNMGMVMAAFAGNPVREQNNPPVGRASSLVLPQYGRTGTDAFPSSSYYNMRLAQANSRANQWGGCTAYHEHYGVPRCQP